RFGQTLPRVSGKLALLVSSKLVGASTNNAAGFQALPRHHDRFEHVRTWYHQQRDRLAFFFRDGDYGRKQFLFVVIKKLAPARYLSPARGGFAGGAGGAVL